MRYEQLVPGHVYRMKPRYEAPLEGGTKVMYIPWQPSGIVGTGARVILLADFEANKAQMDRGEPFTDPPEYHVPMKYLEAPRVGRPRLYGSNAERQRAYRQRAAGVTAAQ